MPCNTWYQARPRRFGPFSAGAHCCDACVKMDFSARPTRYASTFEENEELLAWLKLENVEEVLEPELPICDPHRERHMPLLLLLLRPLLLLPPGCCSCSGRCRLPLRLTVDA